MLEVGGARREHFSHKGHYLLKLRFLKLLTQNASSGVKFLLQDSKHTTFVIFLPPYKTVFIFVGKGVMENQSINHMLLE